MCYCLLRRQAPEEKASPEEKVLKTSIGDDLAVAPAPVVLSDDESIHKVRV